MIGFVSCRITVERVAAWAGVSSDTAKAAEAVIANANFALRCNFISPPCGVNWVYVKSRLTPHLPIGGESLPYLPRVWQQVTGLILTLLASFIDCGGSQAWGG